MRVTRKIQACQPKQQGSKEWVLPDPHEIVVQVETSAQSRLFVAWDLDGEQLKVERHSSCPDNWKAHRVCGKPLVITEENCDYVFYIPGDYRLSTVSGNPLPESLRFEDIVVARETVDLYFAEKRSCCCG